MPRRRAVRVSLVVVAALLVVVLVAATVVTFAVIRRPLPQVSGSVELPGLGAEVSVTRDALGVAHITADSPGDLFRAQGYVHAQDRFFEMDYRRHVTAGRLSELVGQSSDALKADKVIRTLGWRRVAEQELGLLTPATRDALQAYADGVNAYLAQRDPSSLAVEYTILGLQVDVGRPEAWSPVDSLAWLKAMAWDLRGNYDEELARGLTYSAVRDVQRVDELFPPYPQDLHSPILDAASVQTPVATTTSSVLDLADAGVQQALTAVDAALAAVPHLLGSGEGIGSNSWVVGGAHTASGKPLLANDPHLSISAPGIWSQVALSCRQVTAACPYDVSGFSFAGLPGVIIGHNAQLAWGLTNLGADVTDFVLEKVIDGSSVRDDKRVPLATRTETIKVNGGADVELTVRSTSHGPLVSDVLGVGDVGTVPVPDGSPAGRYEVALEWTALTPGRTADAILALDVAANAGDVARSAALFDVPSQNIVYATTDGHIGYQAPGRVPIRANVAGAALPSDGSWPRPGWDSAYDWKGYVDAAALPAVQDPPAGFIVAANQAVTPAGVGPFLTSDWDYGYRSQRIRDVLTQDIATGVPIDVASAGALQMDDRNPYADVLVPALLKVNIADSFDADGQQLLRTWDRRSGTDSPAAAYFAAVWKTLLRLTFWDEMPRGYEPDGGDRWLEVVRTLLDQPDSAWWDDRSTVGVVEGRDEILTRALVSARSELTATLGKDVNEWRWGALHTAAPQHPVLGGPSLPGFVRRLVNPSPLGVAGGSSLVDATSWDASADSFTVTSAPSMRMVVDLGNLDASTWVNLTGTSGHPASVHYTDQFDAWAHGRTFSWPFTSSAVEAGARDRLTLKPSSGG
ncbi:MAG: penicillin acylase family protein [Cellulomonas sp.]